MVGEALAVAAERLGGQAAGVLARLAGPLGHVTREAHAKLAALAAGARKRRRLEIVAVARAPVPVGLRAVHPSQIEHVLAPLPARTRTALAAGATDRVDVWLARWATAGFPPTPGADPRDPLAWLASVGADQFAFALGEAARTVPALASAVLRIAQPPRLGELGPKRAAISRCRDVSLDDDLAFVRVGTRAVAPHLASDQLACLQLLRKLPQAILIVVERELRAHAATSFDQCPTRAALDAS